MLSHVAGPQVPLLSTSIFETLAATAARFPDRDALIVSHEQVKLTWAQLMERVEETARGLIGLGLSAGDRVGIWANNSLEWILVQYACARTGCVLVNVNPAYRSQELAFVLRKSRMKALFLHSSDRRSDYRAILEESKAGEKLSLDHVVYIGEDSWHRMMEGGREVPERQNDVHEVANIQYTSGTTGTPKGVLLTHHNLVNNGFLIARCLRLTEQDRICSPVPMYHCFGCVVAAAASYTTGAAMILPSATFDPLAAMKAVEAERATAIYGVPTMFIAELSHPEFDRFDLTSLRTGVMAGAPCPIEVMKQVIERMHCRQMTIVYGQTEASPIITGSSVDDSVELRVSTVGAVYPCTEVKIISTETGEVVERGEQGELCARGYLIMKGYDGEPAATRKAVDEDGWLHTGDLATMREDGYINITGRARDMIIRGGENIYPREIEEFLYTHPAIADVQVFGLPDEKLGEIVAAWVRMKPDQEATAEDIQKFCRGRIAHFKVPQYVRIVASFPMTVTGKIQKFKMRELEINERGLSKAATVKTA